jgi:drug/metabolite transporter (DMT)-like permease
MPSPVILVCTTLAMLAFAGNSLLCRMALADPLIDPASFTAIRVLSGALALAGLVAVQARQLSTLRAAARAGTWRGAAALFAYAIAFSFAYVTLSASTGALILFGAVQCTMIGVGLARRERLMAVQTLGAVIASGGFVYLLAPGLDAPDPVGALLMALAGLAWGIYSLIGRSAQQQTHDPILATAGNFLRAVPFALAAVLPFAFTLEASLAGVLLATASGALTSGLGYALWYAALKGLAASEAAIVQLTVPVIAALGGLGFLDEPLSFRLVLASVAILGGVSIVLTGRRAPSAP